jgi:hypothetical protein
MQIRGDQLVDEILQATGVDLTEQYAFYAPRTVRVPDDLVAGREAEIQTIIDDHVPNPQYFPEDVERQRKQAADGQAAAIPGWASWTEGEALAWMDANLKALLDAVPDVDNLTADQYRTNAQSIDAQWQDVFAAQQQVIRALVRLVIALRNDTWPRLEGS